MPKSSSESPRILVVDDDPQVAKFFKLILKRGGYTVLLADSGTKALDFLRTETVRLMILDLALPGKDGFEVLKSIRSTAPGLKILAISGLDGFFLDAAKFLGADATLKKIDAPDHLLDVVKDLLKW